MNIDKHKKLEKDGFKVGSVEEFLQSSPWKSYRFYKKIYTYMWYTTWYNFLCIKSIIKWICLGHQPVWHDKNCSFYVTIKVTWKLYMGLRDIACGRVYMLDKPDLKL